MTQGQHVSNSVLQLDYPKPLNIQGMLSRFFTPTKGKTMSQTLKSACNCENEFQDKTYGKGVRICTPVRKKNPLSEQQGRCTVCLRVHDVKGGK